jgi:hypothetical protein
MTDVAENETNSGRYCIFKTCSSVGVEKLRKTATIFRTMATSELRFKERHLSVHLDIGSCSKVRWEQLDVCMIVSRNVL